MSAIWLECLDCDNLFLGTSKYCPDCREKRDIEKQKKKEALKKPKVIKKRVPKTIRKVCWNDECNNEFDSRVHGSSWTIYCPECVKNRAWIKTHD